MKKNKIATRLLAVLMAALMLCAAVPAASITMAGAAKTSTSATAAKKLSKAKVTYTKTLYYTGKARKPKVTVTYGKTTLKKNKDYTVTYKRNTDIGVASIVIKAKKGSAYTGSKTVKFKIIPAKVKDLKAARTTSSAVKLTWSAVKGAYGYVVYRYDAKTKTYTKLKTTKNLSQAVKKLDAGTVYRFAVRAFAKTDKRVYGPYCKVIKVKTKAAAAPQPAQDPTDQTGTTAQVEPTNQTEPTNPPAPVTTLGKVTGLDAEINGANVTFRWTAVENANAYELAQYDAQKDQYMLRSRPADTTVTLKGLEEGATYLFVVRAIRLGDGDQITGAYSEPITVSIEENKPTEPVDLAKVTGVKAQKNGTAVTLSWTAVTGATGYEVAAVDGTTYQKLTETAGTSAKLSDLERLKAYQLVVRAVAKSGNRTDYGDYSDAISVTVYNTDYYVGVFKSGVYTAGLKIQYDTDAIDLTVACKNGNKNMKTTMPMPVTDTTTINATMEIRILKPSGDVKEDHTYVKMSIPVATLTKLALEGTDGAQMALMLGMFNETWLDGTEIMAGSEDMLEMADIFSTLELDNTDSITVSKQTVSGVEYDVETVTGDTMVTKLYYQSGTLKRVDVVSGGETTTIQVTSFSATANNELFERPENPVSMNF